MRLGFSLASVPRASVCILILCVLATPLRSWADSVPALNTLYNFTSADGVAFEFSPLLKASDGNFYGVATVAFPTVATSIFKMTPDGTLAVRDRFATDQSQGYAPLAGMIQAADGYLYGTTMHRLAG